MKMEYPTDGSCVDIRVAKLIDYIVSLVEEHPYVTFDAAVELFYIHHPEIEPLHERTIQIIKKDEHMRLLFGRVT